MPDARHAAPVRWSFTANGEMNGWTVSETATCAVLGGALWLRPAVHPQPQAVRQQMYATNAGCITSPAGLDLPPGAYNEVRIRLRNLSPETDGLVSWRYVERPGEEGGHARFTMRPYCTDWQDAVCHVDGAWEKAVDRISITPLLLGRAGDVWIDRIEITHGRPRPRRQRPDVCSTAVVPKLSLPGISAEDFRDAFTVLDECLIVDVPVRGFPFPVMGPGGTYGENWWQLDSSLTMAGTKWVNQPLAEDMCRGFMAVQAQNPDGRIDLWGGASVRGAPADLSSVPRYLPEAFDVARRSGDAGFRRAVYGSMKGYLEWWLSPVKRDQRTGLITGIAEETFSVEWRDPHTLAPVDLNVEVARGCWNAAVLARALGLAAEAQRFEDALGELRQAVNAYLWNDETGFYHNYDVRSGARDPTLICTTFDPFLLGIAPAHAARRLVPRLTDPALFNWGGTCLTSVAKTDSRFVEAAGPYDGRAWFGDVWTMRNAPVIAGLEDIGRHDLAADLAWSTVRAFSGRYAEYLVPSTGSGEGVQRYGWTASQYLQCIIEHLFGVDADAMESRVRVIPRFPATVRKETASLTDLLLPTGGRISVVVGPGPAGATRVEVEMTGGNGLCVLEIGLPCMDPLALPRALDRETGTSLPVLRDLDGLHGVAGVRLPGPRARVELSW
jgi:hypothetical protein